MARKMFAEFLGTFFLVATVVGSGAMMQNLTHDIALQLIGNMLATVFVLALLIELLGPVSGSHFNPLVTIIFWLRKKLSFAGVIGFIASQIAGAIAGAITANEMFNQPAVSFSKHIRTGNPIWLGEVIATAGLIFVIFQAVALQKSSRISLLVPAWIGSAYLFTSSTSFANPAVTIGRSFTTSFSGISPHSVLGFILAQSIGAVCGLLVLKLLQPRAKKYV